MAIVQMQKVAIIALKDLREEVISLLQREGVLEVSEARGAVPVDHGEVQFREAELEFAIQALLPFAPPQVQAALRKPMTEDEVERAALQTDMRGILDEVHRIEAQIRGDHEHIKQIQHGGPLDPDIAGALPQDAALLRGNVAHEHRTTGTMSLPPAARESAREMAAKERTLKQDLEENKQRLVRLSEELPNLVRARQYLRWLDGKQAVREAMRETKQTVTLMGWMAKKKVHALETKLNKISTATALVRIKADADEHPPVMLSNAPFIAPFESVTTLYGLPQAKEIDPTPILSPFFILFFALCLTDAGYGAVLAIIMGAYLWHKKLSIQQAPLWWLLFFSGIATFFISIPFGGWFGMTPDQAPDIMTKVMPDGSKLFKGQIWNLGETSGINFFQNLSIALGLIHLSLGIFMAGYMKWRVDEKMAAFWVDWSTLILFAAVAAYFFVPAQFQTFALYSIYASLALVWWGKGYGSSLAMRPVNGFFGLLNLAMGMLGNTLSYLRLLALGLVTGALALAVNLVAEQISSFLPWFLAIPVSILIYVVGHTVNIALNTLGAFIHSGRLQFVEFFGQFFEGGGRAFRPFQRAIGNA